jgi:hypothetical protein
LAVPAAPLAFAPPLAVAPGALPPSAANIATLVPTNIERATNVGVSLRKIASFIANNNAGHRYRFRLG